MDDLDFVGDFGGDLQDFDSQEFTKIEGYLFNEVKMEQQRIPQQFVHGHENQQQEQLHLQLQTMQNLQYQQQNEQPIDQPIDHQNDRQNDRQTDQQMQFINPAHFSQHPTLMPVQTNYDFGVVMPAEQNNSVIFSQNKLFIKMNAKMTFCFSYKEQKRAENLFLRAMIVFSTPAEMHLPVKRCANHRNDGHRHNNVTELASIIKINSPHAVYYGSETGETFKDRLSVVVPLENDSQFFDDNGNISQLIGFEFGCQNSCSSGINRKPTTLVFTLEDENYKILGKGTQEFKVCSCPKRDAERDKGLKRKHESDKACPRGKRPMYPQPTQQIKTEPDSENDNENNGSNNDSNLVNSVVPMTPITLVVPTEIASDVFHETQKAVALLMYKNGPIKKPFYENCLKDLKKLQKNYEKK